MARRLARLFEEETIAVLRARRRIAARVCLGQDAAMVAAREGIDPERAADILAHPLILGLVAVWRHLLAWVREGHPNEALERLGERLLTHELETGNRFIVNLVARFLVQVGHPGRGLLLWTVQRFVRLAQRQRVTRRPRADRPGPSQPSLEEPSLDEQEARAAHRAMREAALATGMLGGLDLRRLPRDWVQGVGRSLFDQVCGLIERRLPLLLGEEPGTAPPPRTPPRTPPRPPSRPPSKTPAPPPPPATSPALRAFKRALLGSGARASPHAA
jgi:hypothetical protein